MFIVWRSGQEEEPTTESRLLSYVIRFGTYVGALWLADRWVRGIEIDGWEALVAAAAILGMVNALVNPIVQLVGCPITCLTLGLFALMINAAMLALTAWIAGQFDLAVEVNGFWAAFLGALLVGVVSALLNALLGRPLRRVLT